jgi:hypothetical protein
MPTLPQSSPATASRPATRPTPSPARPAALLHRSVAASADKMCRDVVSKPKDRPAVEGVATVRFLGAGGASIEVECAKVWDLVWQEMRGARRVDKE